MSVCVSCVYDRFCLSPGLPPLPPGLAAVLRPPAGILPDPSAFQGGLPPFPPIGMHHLNPLNFRPVSVWVGVVGVGVLVWVGVLCEYVNILAFLC